MSIFTHVTLGTNDLDRAKCFYDQVLEPLNFNRNLQVEGKAYGWGIERPQLIVLYPRDGKPATVGNGMTIGLVAPNPAAVREFHRCALEAGGADEGSPGVRPFNANSYAAYIRDPDGNKLVAVCSSIETPEERSPDIANLSKGPT